MAQQTGPTPEFDERGPVDDPLQRIYQTADHWIYLGATADQASDVVTALDGESGDDLLKVLSNAIKRLTCVEAIARITSAGAGGHQIETAHSLMSEPVGWAVRRDARLDDRTDEFGIVTTFGPIIRFSATPMVPGDNTHSWDSDRHEVVRRFTGAAGARSEVVHSHERQHP